MGQSPQSFLYTRPQQAHAAQQLLAAIELRCSVAHFLEILVDSRLVRARALRKTWDACHSLGRHYVSPLAAVAPLTKVGGRKKSRWQVLCDILGTSKMKHVERGTRNIHCSSLVQICFW